MNPDQDQNKKPNAVVETGKNIVKNKITDAALTKGAELAASVAGTPALGAAVAAGMNIAKNLTSSLGISFRKNKALQIGAIGGAAMAGIAALASPVGLIAIGGTMLVGALVGGIAFAAVAAALPAIIGILIGSIFVLAGIVAFIIFVINTGGYIVPPSTNSTLSSSGGITNPYIQVTKTANPAGPFQNGDPRLGNITYTVTIQARQGSLTNIRFQDVCQAVRNSGTTECPTSLPPRTPDIIDTTQPFEFSYSENYIDQSFQDTLVTNTFTITADAEEHPNQTAAAIASVVIGNPPAQCPNGWPVLPERGETVLPIVQGPDGTFSHIGYEAIDISTRMGDTVTARNSGVVYTYNTGTSGYGRYVEILSTCGSAQYMSLYAHLSGFLVTTGQTVSFGQPIGLTGTSYNIGGGPHLHYEFRPPDNGTGSQLPVPRSQRPILMQIPYIPKNVTRGCTIDNCNVSIP